MTTEIEKLKSEAETARFWYKLGAISRDEAERRIRPYAKAFNAKAVELAKKYHLKAGRFSLAAYLR